MIHGPQIQVKLSLIVLLLLLWCTVLRAQNTQIRGFVETHAMLQDGKLSFGLGEQDLFITSELHDNISFLGESVFRFSSASPTLFNVSVERVIMNYNYKGNHSLLVGKHHTPLNYWNDSYHHGRVFFPTIGRPLLFDADIIPIHTTGISLQGLNLGKLRFGYDLMIGNGLGSNDVIDNDKTKSITAAVHIKPVDGLQIRTSFYSDVISEGARIHGDTITQRINQRLYTASVAYFGGRFELLAESTLASNRADRGGTTNTLASYIYAGFKVDEKWVPYVRLDHLNYEEQEAYFHADNVTSYVAGIRYEINYLAVVKLEYQYMDWEIEENVGRLTAQFAIGF